MRRFLDLLFGKHLASKEEEEHKVGVIEGVPMLGLDALASSSYGPEAALTVLLPLGLLGLQYLGPIVLIILAILTVLYFSYRQTIAAYPGGGGSYTVAKENLGVGCGLLAAGALMLDYVLNAAVAISAGVAALVSVFPQLNHLTLPLGLGVLALITLVNLRGTKESGVAWAAPTYLFIVSLGLVLGIGLFKTVTSGGHPTPVIAPHALPAAAGGVSLWLLMRAFASGCTAMTGVEAVSNGVPAFAQPAARGAQRTLTVIVIVLGLLLAGIAYLARVYGVGAMRQDEPEYQSVISQLTAAIVGHSWAYYVTLGSVLTVLALSANTSFADLPRLCRLLAEDDFLPHTFAVKGRRLVYSQGILILAVLSGLLLVVFGGITDRLIPLFAVGAFLAFTLSQAGMVMHWRRQQGQHGRMSLLLNAAGAVATGVALLVVLVAKFQDGAWITVLLVPATTFLFSRVKRHYDHVGEEVHRGASLDLQDLQPPVFVVTITGWSRVTAKALQFAMRMSPDVTAVHVGIDEEEERALRRQWAEFVEGPARRASLVPPRLEMLPSTHRHLVGPLLDGIQRLERAHPGRQIAVVVPELVGARWWQYFLHNQRSSLLKAALLVRGGRRNVVINVPWYLSEEAPEVAPSEG